MSARDKAETFVRSAGLDAKESIDHSKTIRYALLLLQEKRFAIWIGSLGIRSKDKIWYPGWCLRIDLFQFRLFSNQKKMPDPDIISTHMDVDMDVSMNRIRPAQYLSTRVQVGPSLQPKIQMTGGVARDGILSK